MKKIYSLLLLPVFLLVTNGVQAYAPVSVTELVLINADTDQEIITLHDGDVLNLAHLPTRKLNVTVHFQPSTLPLQVKSVVFLLNGSLHLENNLPYALKGNQGSDYYAWTPALGSYTLTATPYTAAKAGGTAGNSLTIRFTVIDQPLNLPKAVYRINTGGGDYISPQGVIFEKDNYYFAGTAGIAAFYNATVPDIQGTDMDRLYRSERINSSDLANFSYYLPVAAGNYTVKLHFAEIYFGVEGGRPGVDPLGKRVFDVNVDGDHQLTNLDIAAEAGMAKALVKTFEVSSSDGNITIGFTGKVNRPKISAIEVLVSDAPNHPPVADAGADKVISLPTNETTLVATWSDEDGSITAYGWSQVKGPAARLSGANTSNLGVTDLVAGTYVFRFSVTDDKLASDSDEVTVTVYPAPALGLSVYPNPTEQLLNIRTNGEGAMSVRLYNRFGKLVYEKLKVPANELQALDVATFPAGNYLLRVESGKTKESLHIVKN